MPAMANYKRHLPALKKAGKWVKKVERKELLQWDKFFAAQAGNFHNQFNTVTTF